MGGETGKQCPNSIATKSLSARNWKDPEESTRYLNLKKEKKVSKFSRKMYT